MEECESCRDLFTELRDLHAVQLAHVPSLAIDRDPERESRIKRSILCAARDQSVRTPDPQEVYLEYEKPEIALIGPIRGKRAWSIGASLIVVGACLVFALVSRHTRIVQGHASAVPPVATAMVQQSSSALAERTPNPDAELLQRKVSSLETQVSRLESLLRESETENSKIQNDSSEAQRQVAALSKELQNVRAAEASVSQKLDQLNAERQSDQTAIAAQNREIRSLTEKLEDQATNQDKARDVVEAERDLHELVGARNLRIEDVYDTDSRGKTKKAVGRVFYTEGKSLVFYAYDLSNGNSDARKYVYYVWGNKDGNLDTVRNLGTLGADDQLQKRWKLQVSDAKALADIDRVFVTVEPAGKLGPRPRGKKILSAYLGGPVNHP
jgi:hypothetical protein